LSFCDGKQSNWLDVIRLIGSSCSPVIWVLQDVGAIMGIPTTDITIPILAAIFRIQPSVELAHFIIRTLLFKTELEVVSESFERSILMFTKRFGDTGRVDVAISVSSTPVIDYDLVVIIVTFLLTRGSPFLVETSPIVLVPNFTIVCHLLCQIALINIGDAANLAKGLFIQISNTHSRQKFFPGFLFLLDSFSEDDNVCEMVFKKLIQIEPGVSGAELRVLLLRAKQQKNNS
jgi:hypothetical protein